MFRSERAFPRRALAMTPSAVVAAALIFKASTMDPCVALLFKNSQANLAYGDGIFNVCPTRSLLGSMPGFADCNASSLMPYFRAIAYGVSPA